MESEFGIVDFVVDVLFKSIIASIHPSDVRVALHVNANGGVEGVGVIDGDSSVVNHDKVAICAEREEGEGDDAAGDDEVAADEEMEDAQGGDE
mgnify:CR=1 FL=1